MPDIISDAESKMKGAVEHAREEFAAIRTGRAHPAMFNKLMVDYYGSPTPLQQLATFQVPEARTVLISPFDRSSMAGIEKAIRDSDLGVNPANDGNVIRVVMPQLSEDRRRDYVKLAKHKAEEGRVAVRNIRRHANDSVHKLVKDKEVGEDDARGAEKTLDGVTKKYVDSIDELLKSKEAELLEV
ncbi:MAG: ribosome recycling factor [Micropruina glycogenica]|uniref:ribosome recycling factor n=1 Tax=Micropruina glycogenica TaxID=75385 RepID=UPI00156EB758|nr:ribosome recycling factor [Micropruina glycogenica]MCB0892189.1 ribosome recycling factor [Propionibacteriaceae bacterium]